MSIDLHLPGTLAECFETFANLPTREEQILFLAEHLKQFMKNTSDFDVKNASYKLIMWYKHNGYHLKNHLKEK